MAIPMTNGISISNQDFITTYNHEYSANFITGIDRGRDPGWRDMSGVRNGFEDLAHRIDSLRGLNDSSKFEKAMHDLCDVVEDMQGDICTLQDTMDEILSVLKEKK